MLGCSSPTAPTSTSAQSTTLHSAGLSKHDRNKPYYQKNKSSIKGFKMEVKRDEEGRLVEIRKQINSVRNQLLSNGKPAGNIDVMELLLDCWLSRNSSNEQQAQNTIQAATSLQTNSSDIFSIEHDIRPPEITYQSKTQLHSSCTENEVYLVCGTALQLLFRYFFEGRSCCQCGEKFDLSTLNIKRITKNNHCVKAEWKCKTDKDTQTVQWFSSSIISGKYCQYEVNACIVWPIHIKQ